MGIKQGKMQKVMLEFKAGTLKSSSGSKVTNRKQAVAIGMSEAAQAAKKRKK
jgi:V8-like Glu-specific endopeptidase